MSSNGSDLQAQRVVSIRRKLHQGMLLKKISIYLGADLLLFFLIFFIFLLGQIMRFRACFRICAVHTDFGNGWALFSR